jgi:hypothetical protein
LLDRLSSFLSRSFVESFVSIVWVVDMAPFWSPLIREIQFFPLTFDLLAHDPTGFRRPAVSLK